VTRLTPRLRLALALVIAALAFAACGGDDDEPATTSAPTVEAPAGGSATSGELGALPPGFVECMAEQGYEIESQSDIHSAPADVLQDCFGAAH
jgi:hypothetical protein